MRAMRRNEASGKSSPKRVAVAAVCVFSHALLFLLGVNWARLRSGVAPVSVNSPIVVSIPLYEGLVVPLPKSPTSTVAPTLTAGVATAASQTATALPAGQGSVVMLGKVEDETWIKKAVELATIKGGLPTSKATPSDVRTRVVVFDLLMVNDICFGLFLPPLMKVKAEKHVIYTWTNFHMRDFLLNWLLWLKEHGITNYVIGALDVELETYLKDIAPQLGVRIAILSLNSGLTTGDYGWNTPAFKRMAKFKFLPVQRLLTAGVDVTVCDTDTVWMKNPLPFFYANPDPDILTSTDVLRQMPLKEQLHSTLNIGIMMFRSTPSCIQFVDTFYNEMVDDPAFGTGNAEWDQSRFNRMVREGSSLGPPDKPWIDGWNKKVKVQALHIVDFPNGHVMFAQQLPQKLGVVPFIVHATFQYGGTWGKRNRFREWRMWLADEDSYYDPTGGLLYYTPNIPQALIDRGSQSMDTHFELMNFQLAQLRSAWGIARSLGRVLIMPAFVCGMDRVWFPHGGVFPGSDPLFTIPFSPCPMDHILDPETMDKRGLLERIREFSFLSNERVSAAVSGSTAEIDWIQDGSTAATAVANADVTMIKQGVTDGEIKTALVSVAGKKVLHFLSMPLGFASFKGFDRAEDWVAFEEDMRKIPAMWCCIDEQQAKQRGQPFPPGQTWYDLLWDIIPHTDRFGRTFDTKWDIMLGP